MKISIDVADRQEADRIRRALADPQVRAFVNIVGALASLSSDRARERVLRFVDDHLEEENAQYVSVFREHGQ